MKWRCRRAHKARARYFDRGIEVCGKWANSYEAFLADMGRAPPGSTLDRIDNERGYEAGNCRWATRLEQQNNRSNTTKVTIGDRTIALTLACSELGIKRTTLRRRLQRGLPLEAPLRKSLPVVVAGRTMSVPQAAALIGCSAGGIWGRARTRGETLQEAFDAIRGWIEVELPKEGQ